MVQAIIRTTTRPNTYTVGVHDISSTITIERQRRELGVPQGPTTGNTVCYPAGALSGEDQIGTVLKFSPTITGALITTEKYNDGTIIAYWNHDGTCSSEGFYSLLCPLFEDFTIEGQADLLPYQRYIHSLNPHPFVADGIRVQGTSARIQNVSISQVRGTAINLLGANAHAQCGNFGTFEQAFHRVSNIWINNCFRGIELSSGDDKLSDIWIGLAIEVGILNRSPGMVLNTCHIQGSDIGFLAMTESEINDAYIEACRIGTYIYGSTGLEYGTGSAHGTRINGLNTGPGTCWGRNVLVEAHSVKINNLHGMVGQYSDEFPDNAGIEYIYGDDCDLRGSLNPLKNCRAIIHRGNRSHVDMTVAWNHTDGSPTAIVLGNISGVGTQGSEIIIRGHGKNGVGFDFTDSALDTTNGAGNEFKLVWEPGDLTDITIPTTPAIYPGGDIYYNLAPGTSFWINGELQRTGLAGGLVDYWKMDEQASGTSVASVNTSSPNFGLTARVGHPPTFSTTAPLGVYASSRTFDSADGQCLSLAHNSAFLLGAGKSFTLGLWTKIGAWAYGVLASKNGYFTTPSSGWNLAWDSSGTGVGLFKLFTYSTQLGTQSPGGPGSSTAVATSFGSTYVANTWYCVMIGFNANTGEQFIRVNDSAIDTSPQTLIWGSVAKLSFGCNDEDSGFQAYKGQIGPAAYWNRALSQSEMDLFYGAGAGITYADIIA
jgi:hypothetical protein